MSHQKLRRVESGEGRIRQRVGVLADTIDIVKVTLVSLKARADTCRHGLFRFFGVAVATLAYQVWAVGKRPPSMRTWGMKAILGVSLALNGLLIAGWIVIRIRYQ